MNLRYLSGTFLSDHILISVKASHPEDKSRSNSFHCNNTLLKYSWLKSKIKDIWNCLGNVYFNAKDFWNLANEDSKDAMKACGREVKKPCTMRIQEVERQAREAKEKLYNGG